MRYSTCKSIRVFRHIEYIFKIKGIGDRKNTQLYTGI